MVAPLVVAGVRAAAKAGAKAAAKNVGKQAVKKAAKKTATQKIQAGLKVTNPRAAKIGRGVAKQTKAYKERSAVVKEGRRVRVNAGRQLKNVESTLKSNTLTHNQRAALQNASKELKNAISETKLKRSEYGKSLDNERLTEIKAAQNKVQSLTDSLKTLKGTANGLQNYFTQNQINNASAGITDLAGGKTAAEVKVFYRATQQLWEGTNGNINNTIVREMYKQGLIKSKSLQEAWDYTMTQESTQAALKEMTSEKGIDDTGNERYEYGIRLVGFI